jgi:vacuolar-type H+-ATPase subunit F/Vma7
MAARVLERVLLLLCLGSGVAQSTVSANNFQELYNHLDDPQVDIIHLQQHIQATVPVSLREKTRTAIVVRLLERHISRDVLHR